MADVIVLIVDDDLTIVRLCQRLLERASYQVLTAMDPFQALKILETQKVNLLLSDIHMPLMDGFELISRAKQYQPELPVLVMTGYGSIENAIQALHRGVEGLILKPFDNSAELVRSVQRVLEESRQRRDAARLQALRPLFDVTETLLSETSSQLLEKRLINTMQDLFQANCVGIYQWDLHKDLKEIVCVSENLNNARLSFLSMMTVVEMPLLASLNGTSIDPQVLGVMEESGLETVMIASVDRNGSRFFFCIGRERAALPFIEADLEMFIILARQAVVAMENARLYSELKQYVRQIEESQRALIQMEKMAAVGRLMASMAHEINNPLQAVGNCLHLAARPGLETNQRLRYIEMTERELERLVHTVRRMLDFYRAGGSEKENTGIHEIIHQVLAILQPQLNDRGITVNVGFTGEIRSVYLISEQIQQVIFNLLLNAMDALDEMSAITTKRTLSKKIWIDVIFELEQVRILIEDSGPGIPDGLQERIFEPFISTKQHGTGLGLAVSYGIMERHQGNLHIYPSRYGSGACFELLLPLGEEAQDDENINR